MRFVTPSVTLLARTQPDTDGVRTWLEILGVTDMPLPLDDLTPGEALTVLAGLHFPRVYDVATAL